MADRLEESVERHFLRPFEWGVSDCCLAACNVLVDLGWPDPAKRYRGRYQDKAGALSVMQGTVDAVAERETARLGWPEVCPADAQDGDVGLVRRSLAVRMWGRWIIKSPGGFIMAAKARRAWRPK